MSRRLTTLPTRPDNNGQMNPSIDLSQTLDFVKSYVPPEKAHILEVGCGKGRLAQELMRAGYRVTAIDLNPEAVEIARRNDVAAEVADICDFGSTEKFDAVLFTHSLHHVHHLDNALNNVKTLLDEKGRLLVEDFSIEQMDAKTADWFYEMRDFVDIFAGKARPKEETELPTLTRWKNEHTHEPRLKSRAEMIEALERRFTNVVPSTAPYLYRYFVHRTEDLAHGAEAAERVFQWERKLIGTGTLQPIGLRVVAKKYFSYLK